jgi:hypothetical protein
MEKKLVFFRKLRQLNQQYFSYIVAVSFIGGEKKPEYPVKITDLPQITEKPYHLMLN